MGEEGTLSTEKSEGRYSTGLPHTEVTLGLTLISVVLEKTLGSPLDSRAIKPVNPKGNQFLIFIGRTDAKAETPMLWPPDAKN